MSITSQYYSVLNSIINYGVIEKNERTGHEIAIAPSPISFTIDLSEGLLPLVGNRTIYPKVAAAEVAWQLLGTKDPSFIMRHAPKVWSDFIEDDEIKNAYGYRWCNHFGRNQILEALNTLKEDPSSRQVYISTWDPAIDGLGEKKLKPKNIPCIVGFTLNIIGGKLNMTVSMRSSDAYVGLPYDVLTYALMVDAFAASLGLKRGYMSFMLAHAHIYDTHLELAKQELANSRHWANNIQTIEMPGYSIEQIADWPLTYVDYFKKIKINNFNGTKPRVVV